MTDPGWAYRTLLFASRPTGGRRSGEGGPVLSVVARSIVAVARWSNDRFHLFLRGRTAMRVRKPGRVRAFKLVELVIVVAIITLLVALALPAMQKMRADAAA